ncbi:5-bromo-4-chloroindolyl phosphate hydrolysis family protein [Rhodobacteraceae bacterium S2214]|nr:5-bromo-4-chloroindolyl phosphate hydrolysis family protein [Rhodobacteraceae bacterium S2214]
MAKKFGGKYSPNGTSSGADIRETPPDRPIEDNTKGTTLLFVPAIILVFTSINDGPAMLAIALLGAALLTFAAWFTREGLQAQAEYDARRVARKPAIPRKMIASLATGLGITLAAYTGDTGLIGSVIYGIVGAVLHTVAFGVDPLKDKRMEGVDTFQQDRVARVVDQADASLAAMKDHIARLEDRDLTARVASFDATARKMARTVEEDPRDLTRARKYLGVYLEGARDATVKFVDLYTRKPDPSVRTDYIALLDDLQDNFAARTDKMMEDDRTDMDIEIKVLRDRLQRDGL